MSPADVLDAIAPSEEAQALAWLWAAAADEDAAALMVDDLPRLVAVVSQRV